MRNALLRPAAAFAAALGLSTAAAADEGMWTFDAFPAAKVKAAYGFAPDQAWLDTVRGATARLTVGCSSSVVSAQGLVLTNHHCVIDCAAALSSKESDYLGNGFYAEDRSKEKQCPGLQAEILTKITDVTGDVQGAIGKAIGAALAKARDAAIAKIEAAGCADKATMRCQVVTLYGGGEYKLYTYRKYSDVRLVFAPEYAVGQFGGDPDNFNFPRYGLDASFLRLYENGKPVATPQHLRWDPRAPTAGEPIFVVGNPGRTQRLYTMSQFEQRRAQSLPVNLLLLSEERGRLIEAMAGDSEKARSGAETLQEIENSFKAVYGMQGALNDQAFYAKLAAAEKDLRAKVAADPKLAAKIGDPWGDVATAMAAYRDIFVPYMMLEAAAGRGSTLYENAVGIVRAAAEREKPNGDRLPGYTESTLPLTEQELLAEKPTYGWLEELELSMWLSKVREYLTADDPRVKAMLGKQSPATLAHALVAGTKLGDPKVRKALLDGGMRAVKASDDPLIRFVLANDPAARAVNEQYRSKVDGPVTAAQSRLAQARFAIYGKALYPDATFTPRVSYGAVTAWTEAGRALKPTTDFAGLFDRVTGEEPYALPKGWLDAKAKLDPKTVLDFATSTDVVGGNSGSPVIARDASVIGALFDGNIHSLGGSFGYDPMLNRSVVVSAAAVDEALRKVYGAAALADELHAQ